MNDYPTGNIENYTDFCVIEADLSHLPLSRLRKYSGEGHFYRCEYEIVLRFGLTELKAMIAWRENVSLLLVYCIPCIYRVVRVLNDGAQRRLFTIQMNQIPRTMIQTPEGLVLHKSLLGNSLIGLALCMCT